MTSEVPGVPGAEPVWNDGHWWWWDGDEWLLGTNAGWQRLDTVYGATTVEPVTEALAEPFIEPAVAEPIPVQFAEPVIEPAPEPIATQFAEAVAAPEAAPVVEPQPAQPEPAEPVTAIVPLIAPTVVASNVLPAIDGVSATRGGRGRGSRGPGRGRPLSRGFVITLLVVLLAAIVGGVLLWRSGTGNTSQPTPKPSGVAGTVATIGANLADWSVKHPAAAGYPAGTAFVSAPGLPVVNGKPGARYTNVVTSNNLITSFRFNLPPNSTVGTARFALVRELPTDSTLLDARVLGTCEIAHYTSLILSQVQGAANQSGSIVVIFRSGTVTFDPHNLAYADVTATSNIPDHC